MNKLIKEIDEIRNRISYIEFKNYLSGEDYQKIREYENQIQELEKQLKGQKGIVVEFVFKDDRFSKRPHYLTANPNLCFCDEPTIFDSIEEAQEYLDKAYLDKDKFDITFKEWRL